MPSTVIDVPIDGFYLYRSAAVLFIFLAASSFTVLSLFVRLNPNREDLGVLAALSVAIGPLLLAWLLSLALTLFPGWSASSYILLAAVLVGPLGVIGAVRHGPVLLGLVRSYFFDLLKTPISLIVLIFLFGALLLALGQQIVLATFQPVTGNDPLEYMTAARLVADARSLDGYPFLDGEATGGFMAPWTHPPSYLSLIAFSYWLQGSADYAGAAKFLAPYFVGAQALLLIVFAERGRRLAGPLAALLCLSTPIYFHVAAIFHIDPMRIATFTAAGVAVWLLAPRMTLGAAIIAGVAVGASHFSHSIGFLTLAFMLPLYVLTARGSVMECVRIGAVMTAVSVLIVAPFAWKNIAVFGALLQDAPVIWTYPEIRYEETLAVDRGLFTVPLKIFAGALRGFTQPDMFGLLYWALAASLAATLAHLGFGKTIALARDAVFRRTALSVALILSGGYIAFLLLTIALGVDTAIKNLRYVLTIQPFIAVALAHLLTHRFERVKAQTP